MSDNNYNLIEMMKNLGLSSAESTLYLELLNGPTTHLKLSRQTGITRSRVYHLIEVLEKKGLVVRYVDDTGVFIKASDPNNLEIELTAEEERLKGKRETLEQLIPALKAVKKNDPTLFSVKTYEGKSGLRQMAWHEVKAKSDVLCLGYAEMETLINDARWSELHRQMSVDAGHKVREILNNPKVNYFTNNQDYLERYECRYIPAEILPLDNQIAIYDDTVSVYHWRESKQVGVEITSKTYAKTMRALFENYWMIAKPAKFEAKVL